MSLSTWPQVLLDQTRMAR
uniref:Uncharacterized protein n=1 Tax=Rhizophora mucronata TaxID=61149 RepID=A0A2P2NFN1_RHIMU